MNAARRRLTIDEKVTPSWEECWERVLRLPLSEFDTDTLSTEAEWLVRRCRKGTGDQAIAWFEEQVEEGRAFVAEQLAANPDDSHWQRIYTVLTGTQAGLAGER